MKIYFDNDKEMLIISGAKQSFAPKALTATLEGDVLTVWDSDNTTRVLKTRYINIMNENNLGFENALECLQYLEVIFSKSGSGNFNGGHF